MDNREMTKEEQKTIQEEWEKLYAKDLKVIGGFIKSLRQSAKKSYRLYFKDGAQIIATFVGAADSDNGLDLNDPYYEELYELDFRINRIENNGTELEFVENERISLNYHNFFIKFEPYENR